MRPFGTLTWSGSPKVMKSRNGVRDERSLGSNSVVSASVLFTNSTDFYGVDEMYFSRTNHNSNFNTTV